MIRMLRLYGLMALCFALVAGSVSMAVARGHATALARGGSTLVICSGYGVMTISLDAKGYPIGPVHPCPDCLAGLVAYIAPEQAPLMPQSVTFCQAAAPVLPMLAPGAAFRLPRAREPPRDI